MRRCEPVAFFRSCVPRENIPGGCYFPMIRMQLQCSIPSGKLNKEEDREVEGVRRGGRRKRRRRGSHFTSKCRIMLESQSHHGFFILFFFLFFFSCFCILPALPFWVFPPDRRITKPVVEPKKRKTVFKNNPSSPKYILYTSRSPIAFRETKILYLYVQQESCIPRTK